MGDGMTAAELIDKWRKVTQTEKAVSQSHFNDLCGVLGERTPVEADPEGDGLAEGTGTGGERGKRRALGIGLRGRFGAGQDGPTWRRVDSGSLTDHGIGLSTSRRTAGLLSADKGSLREPGGVQPKQPYEPQ